MVPFDLFNKIARAEWDTLLFFYGVVVCVGGIGFMGYLALLSETVYTSLGPTFANVMPGLMSAAGQHSPGVRGARWMPAMLPGHVAAVWVHLWLNRNMF